MSNTSTPDSILTLVQQMVRALADKKAGDLRVLKVSGKSTITDYLVLATGTSDPHLRALRIEVERVLDAAKHPICGMEVGGYDSGWTVVDAYQIMAHIFTPEQRGNYALERLWKDAESLDVAKMVEEPKVVAPVVKPAAQSAAKPVVKAVVAKAVKAPAKSTSKKPSAAKGVVKKTVKKTITEPAVIAKKAVVKKPAAVKKTVVKKALVKKPAAKTSVAKKVSAKPIAAKRGGVKPAVVKKAGVAKKVAAKKKTK